MSLAVVPDDGDLSAVDARELTERIKVVIGGAWELIRQAYEERAHVALGYPSWDAYCSAEFGASRLKLPREERQEVVASLRESGLSNRAIASATGIDESTVRADLKAGAGNPAPAPWAPLPDPVAEVAPAGYLDTDEPTVEDDDQQWTAANAEPGEWAPGDEITNDEQMAASVEALPGWPGTPVPSSAPKITGTDGKSYPASAPAPARPRRGPLVDDFNKAGWELDKAIRRLERLAGDDRFPGNREQVAAALRGHLTYATGVLTDLLRGFDTDPTEDR